MSEITLKRGGKEEKSALKKGGEEKKEKEKGE